MMAKKKNTNYIVIGLIIALALAFTACASSTQSARPLPTQQPGGSVIDPLQGIETSQDLKKFSTPEEVQAYLQSAQAQNPYSMFGGMRGGVFMNQKSSMLAMAESGRMADAAVPTSAPSARYTGDGGSASDYSTTNIQVEGVDEADFVKNDGRYIYMLSQEKLLIIDAYPAENAKIISRTEFEGRPRELFINKNRLIVFVDDYEEAYTIDEFDFVPRQRTAQITRAYVYDVMDRTNPILVKQYDVSGTYFQSRMIGDYVYIIAKQYPYYYGPFIETPVVKSFSGIMRPDIYYFDNPEWSYTFHTIASFSVRTDDDKINAQTFMLGDGNTLYVSQDNIYIAYQKNIPYHYYRVHNEARFFDIVLPLFPSSIRNAVEKIRAEESDEHKKWDRIRSVIEDMYNRMDEDEKEELVKDIENAISEYEERIQAERAKSIIHRIHIQDGMIAYLSKGEVPGYLLNQFSMDEHNDNLRLATTTNYWGRDGSIEYNNVYVLDKSMNIIGMREHIAPDERIYSTRFIGDRLYMVTFKRVDPLFVIDLSDPREPRILGKLKIPGYSDYLHPYDENHLIGIGKEVGENDWGGVSTKGVKVALFDVSDVENPKQIDTYEIGEAGSDSEALHDHKAFLFSKEKSLLVIPVREVKGQARYDPRFGYTRQKIWQGAYVFGIDVREGFTLRGKITHLNDGDDDQYYYSSPSAVRRSLYMDDVLYTISSTMIKMNNVENINEEIKEVTLPFRKDRYWDYAY